MNFPQRLNEMRKAKRCTAKHMADFLGVSIRTYRNWESGHVQPSLENLVILATYLDVSTDYLLGLSDNPARRAD